MPSKHWDYKQDVSTTRYCVGTGDENFELEFVCGVYCVVSALSIEPSSQILCNIILSNTYFIFFQFNLHNFFQYIATISVSLVKNMEI